MNECWQLSNAHQILLLLLMISLSQSNERALQECSRSVVVNNKLTSQSDAREKGSNNTNKLTKSETKLQRQMKKEKWNNGRIKERS